MNLKSGCIFWPQIYRGPQPNFKPLPHDIQCDVAIIGSGISGALAAYHLTRQGVHTVMVDRRPIAHGSTAASTGLLQYEIDTPLVDLACKIGRDRAVAAYRASIQTLLAFEPLVQELDDRCGLTARPSLYLASEEKDARSLQEEYSARRAMNIDVSYLSRQALRAEMGFNRPAALWSRQAFEVDPYRLTLALIFRSIQNGLEVFPETEILRCQPHSAGMTLHSSIGPQIGAKNVVFASGYETMDFLPRDLCKLASTFALVSQPMNDFAGWPKRCLIWETARPYLYLRTTQDNRVIIGGEDVDVIESRARDALIPEKAESLRNRCRQLLPDIAIDSDCAWAGTFAQTRDGLPYIGTLPHLPHAFFALGYGGNGITFSLLAAQIITDSFLRRPNQYAKLFGFER